MARSLRFRLPALFLAAVLLAGVASTAIAYGLFQSYTRDASLAELRREADGLTQLYADAALQASDLGKLAPAFAAAKLERAAGARIFYVGVPIFPGQNSGLESLSRDDVDYQALLDGKKLTFELRPPGDNRPFLAVAEPLRLSAGSPPFGGIVVAKPKQELSHQLDVLLLRLAYAFLGGVAIAAVFGLYVSRRIARPLLQLSRAADEIAEGRYEVELPRVLGGDEIGHLAERFSDMTARLAEADEQERNFLMSVSHDLRTPLTSIRGHVMALREGVVSEPDAVQASLDVIAQEAERLERLVGDVLDLAKLEANRFAVLEEEVDMGALVGQAYASFGDEARRRGIDYVDAVSARPVIVSDGDRVLQIISNLLSNAFHWTPDGGRIEVALEAADGIVSVTVADSGPGIAPEQRERIFRPFVTGDGGTGLGLAIAGELAQALGGRVDLESEVGKGSSFRLVLPAR